MFVERNPHLFSLTFAFPGKDAVRGASLLVLAAAEAINYCLIEDSFLINFAGK